MRHHENRQAETFLQFGDQIVERRRPDWVETRRGFIEKQYLWIER